MARIFSLMFPYQGSEQHVLVSTKDVGSKVSYKITIMNGQLEMLMGNANLISEDNGRLLLEDCQDNFERLQLKRLIAEALGDYLNKEVVCLFQ